MCTVLPQQWKFFPHGAQQTQCDGLCHFISRTHPIYIKHQATHLLRIPNNYGQATGIACAETSVLYYVHVKAMYIQF